MSEAGRELVIKATALCRVEPPGYVEALPLLQEAAALGEPEAVYAIGTWYAFGRVVEEDHALAEKHFRRSAELGWRPAMSDLAKSLERGKGCDADLDEAIHWYGKAADHGDSEAAYEAGRALWVQRDSIDSTVVAWWRRSAEEGHAEAQYAIGRCYECGDTVGEDLTQAIKWYRKAAAQGDEDAVAALDDLGAGDAEGR